jgi:hypothetical protein
VEGHINKLNAMQRQRVAIGLVVLALLAGAALLHARAINPIVQTVGMSAVLMAIDAPASAVVVAGNDATGGRVVVLDARTGATVHAIATHGAVAAGDELVPPSLLALDEPALRA